MIDLVEHLKLPDPMEIAANWGDNESIARAVAGAQLARAAWGLVEWLRREAAAWTYIADAARGGAVLWQAEALEEKLRAAGIPRTQEVSDESH